MLNALYRAAGAFMILLAVAILTAFLAMQVSDTAAEADITPTVWRVLNVFLIAALVAIIVDALARKRAIANEEHVSREYVESNVALYYAAALLIILAWNWAGFEFVEPPNDNTIAWLFIDGTAPLLLAARGIRFLRR